MTEPWYGVRCIFKHLQDEPPHLYEERVILVRASSFDEAIERAEAEAVQYVTDLGEAEYLNVAQAFHIASETIEDLTEVYSLMRRSDVVIHKLTWIGSLIREKRSQGEQLYNNRAPRQVLMEK